jgi:hypothetical protein
LPSPQKPDLCEFFSTISAARGPVDRIITGKCLWSQSRMYVWRLHGGFVISSQLLSSTNRSHFRGSFTHPAYVLFRLKGGVGRGEGMMKFITRERETLSIILLPVYIAMRDRYRRFSLHRWPWTILQKSFKIQ